MALPIPPENVGPGLLADDILGLLAAVDEGLPDADIAAALQVAHPGVLTVKVNKVCRKLVAAGRLERVGSRPIRNRALDRGPGERGLTAVAAPAGGDVDDEVGDDTEVAPDAHPPVPDAPPTDASPTDAPPADPTPDDVVPGHHDGPAPTADLDPDPDPAPVRAGALARLAERTGVRRAPVAPSLPAPVPPAVAGADLSGDITQGWSRTVNVTAAVATWLVRHGATIRAAGDGDGPARDLVAHLDGDVVHVEITGWPPDGARTHTTTVAGDWFSAAARGAVRRRATHPRARIVIALPDTRRYRALTTDVVADLAGAKAEVWFVEPSGAVVPR